MFKSPFQLQEKSCSLNDYRIFCFVWFVGWSGAFNACRSLGSVRLPDNAAFTAIPDSLFFECESLQSLAIPQNVTFIGADALNGCDALTAITADESNTVFCSEGGVLYNAGKSTLICHPAGRSGRLDIPGNVTKIGEGAFFNCNNTVFDDPIIPDSVTSIGPYAFNACNRRRLVSGRGMHRRLEFRRRYRFRRYGSVRQVGAECFPGEPSGNRRCDSTGERGFAGSGHMRGSFFFAPMSSIGFFGAPCGPFPKARTKPAEVIEPEGNPTRAHQGLPVLFARSPRADRPGRVKSPDNRCRQARQRAPPGHPSPLRF